MARPARRGAARRAGGDRVGPIKNRARREKIEALIEYTTKERNYSPEEEAAFKDDAWGKRLES